MTRAVFDGRPILGEKPAKWDLVAGVRPQMAEFDFAPSDGNALLGQRLRPLTLEIDNQGKVTRHRNLYIIGERPGNNPNIVRIAIADRRYWWRYNHVLRRYNIRRHVGVKRLLTGRGSLVTDPVVPQIQYAPWSLNNGTPWTAEQVLKDIFDEIKDSEPGGGPALTVAFSSEARGALSSAPVDNLIVDERGDQAMARALGYFSGIDITVDPNGSIRIYSKVGGGEDKTVQSAGAPSTSGAVIKEITGDPIRPKEVHVLFTRELELRFDIIQRARGTTGESPGELIAENVVPIPDFELNVGNKGVVSQGTWVTFPEAVEAWNAGGGIPGGIATLSDELIRRASVPFLDLWGPLAQAGLRDPDEVWSARIGAIQQHYRRTYRLKPEVMERIYRFYAYRVGVLDRETGTRAPAPVWQDYAVVYSQRSLYVDAELGDDPLYAINVTGYQPPSTASPRNLTPAILRIEDHDQGIITIDFLVDKFRLNEMFLPSKIDNMPTEDLSGRSAGIAFNALSDVKEVPELSEKHRVAFIVTATPSSPNTDQQLQRVIRKPQDVEKLLPSAMREGLQNAPAPIMEVRVGPGVDTARVAWTEESGPEIEKALGLREGEPNLDPYVVNQGLQGTAGLNASIDAIADAVAARIYAQFANRQMGSKTAALAPSATIDGFVSRVSHEVTAGDGRAQTTIELQEDAPDLSIFNLLDASTRNLIFKITDQSR